MSADVIDAFFEARNSLGSRACEALSLYDSAHPSNKTANMIEMVERLSVGSSARRLYLRWHSCVPFALVITAVALMVTTASRGVDPAIVSFVMMGSAILIMSEHLIAIMVRRMEDRLYADTMRIKSLIMDMELLAGMIAGKQGPIEGLVRAHFMSVINDRSKANAVIRMADRLGIKIFGRSSASAPASVLASTPASSPVSSSIGVVADPAQSFGSVR